MTRTVTSVFILRACNCSNISIARMKVDPSVSAEYTKNIIHSLMRNKLAANLSEFSNFAFEGQNLCHRFYPLRYLPVEGCTTKKPTRLPTQMPTHQPTTSPISFLYLPGCVVSKETEDPTCERTFKSLAETFSNQGSQDLETLKENICEKYSDVSSKRIFFFRRRKHICTD